MVATTILAVDLLGHDYADHTVLVTLFSLLVVTAMFLLRKYLIQIVDPKKKALMPPLLVIVGETASGKSALALELARRFNGELICADSWTVYEGFDIGTAKPSKLERAMVPHHLLDVANAHGGFNAVVFQQLALAAIDDVSARGKLPILVGGTGLYIDSVLFHYQFPAAPPAGMREQLNRLNLDELLAEAERLGIGTASIDTRNKRRVIRLIENDGALPARKPLRENTLILGIKTPAATLEQRMAERVDTMLAAGLEAEVSRLADEYGWDAEPLRGVGYAQWKDYFLGSQSLDETRARIIKATKDLAKRQRTWFKRNDSIQWLSTPVNMDAAADIVTTFLHTS